MSRFTDDLYRSWLARNGSHAPRRSPSRGMGGVPPMVTGAFASAPGYSRGAAVANDDAYSRPGKQDADYVDNIIESAPPSFLMANEDYHLGHADYDDIHRIW